MVSLSKHTRPSHRRRPGGASGYTSLMLPDTLQLALKEWAVVQRSLLEQHQILVVRKGGIAEETGDFDLRSHRFLIYPTYEHEHERSGDVQPCFETWLREEEVRSPDARLVKIECACEVVDVIRLNAREPLVSLMPQHIWSRQFIDGRFDWEPYKPVFALLLRAYRLAQPSLLPYRRDYGGCRSWVTLEEEISTAGAVPAMASDTAFKRRVELTKYLLEG